MRIIFPAILLCLAWAVSDAEGQRAGKPAGKSKPTRPGASGREAGTRRPDARENPRWWSETDPRWGQLTPEQRASVTKERQGLAAYAELATREGFARSTVLIPSEQDVSRLAELGAPEGFARTKDLLNPSQQDILRLVEHLYKRSNLSDAKRMCELVELRARTPFGRAGAALQDASDYKSRIENREAAGRLEAGGLVIDILPGHLLPPQMTRSFRKLTGERQRRSDVYHVCNATGSVDRIFTLVDPFAQGPIEESVRRIISKDEPFSAAKLVLVTSRAAKGTLKLRTVFPDKFLAFDPDPTTAAAELAKLAQTRLDPARLSVALFLPRTAAQQQAMGLDGWGTPLRRSVWTAAVSFVKRAGLQSQVTWKANGFNAPLFIRKIWGEAPKPALLKALQSEPAVLILFGHGDSQHLVLPDGSQLTVSEVKALKLTNKPLVLLFSCEGAGAGPSDATRSFAEALKGAGASAIWGFEEKVDARDAINLAAQFVSMASSGTVLGAIKELDKSRMKIRAPVMRLKVRVQMLKRGTHNRAA